MQATDKSFYVLFQSESIFVVFIFTHEQLTGYMDVPIKTKALFALVEAV